MERIKVTAKTLDEAITKAAIELGTSSSNLEYTIIEKGNAGLLGFIGSKPVVIEAKRKAEESPDDFAGQVKEAVKPEKKEANPEIEKRPVEKPAEKEVVKPVAKAEAVKEEKPEAPAKKSVDGAVYEDAAKQFLTQVLGAMNMEVELQSSYDDTEKELSVDMVGADMGILIGKRGQTLDSLQYLVSLVVNKGHDGYVRVKLDTENYRSRRKDTLESLAKNIAYKVKRTRRSVALEPMNPYERRIIHSALQNDKYVVTRSEGEDPFRHVVISLKRDARDSRN